MDVVRHAADLNRGHFVLPGDSAEKRPEPLGKLRRNHRTAIFCAEDTVEMRTHVGHTFIQPSLRDLTLGLRTILRSGRPLAGAFVPGAPSYSLKRAPMVVNSAKRSGGSCAAQAMPRRITIRNNGSSKVQV